MISSEHPVQGWSYLWMAQLSRPDIDKAPFVTGSL